MGAIPDEGKYFPAEILKLLNEENPQENSANLCGFPFE